MTKNPRFPYALSEIRAFYHCQEPIAKMTTRTGAMDLAQIAGDAGLTIVYAEPVFVGGGDGSSGYGYTLNCTFTESGGAWDCWPEYGTVLQYLDLCNVTKDNSHKAEFLWPRVAKYFGAQWMYAIEPIRIPIDPAQIDQSLLIPIH